MRIHIILVTFLMAALALSGCGQPPASGANDGVTGSNGSEGVMIGPNTMYMEAPDARVGDTVDVAVKVKEVSGIYGYQLNLTYDPAVLEYVGIEEGDFLSRNAPNGTYGVPVKTDVEGEVANIAYVKLRHVDGEGGSGTLVTVTFRAKNSGISPIGFNNVKFIGTDTLKVPVGIQPGSVNVE